MCYHVLFYYSWQNSAPLREIDKTNISCNTSQCSDAPAPAKQWLSSARLLFIFVSIIRALSYLTSQFWVPIICYPTTILHQFYIEFLKYISDARVLNLVFSRTSSTTLNFFEIAWNLWRLESMQSGTKSILHSDCAAPCQRQLPPNLVLDPWTSINIWPKPNPTKRLDWAAIIFTKWSGLPLMDWELCIVFGLLRLTEENDREDHSLLALESFLCYL